MMKYRLHKFLALVAAVALLCALLPLGAVATDTAASDLMLMTGVSRAETHRKLSDGSSVVALAFRYRINAKGVQYGPGRTTVTDNATVTFDGVTYKLERFGAVMTNKAVIGDNPNAFKINESGVTNIQAKYLFGRGNSYAEYVTRIVNVPEAQIDTLIYARPYFVYKNAEGDEVCAYGDILSANSSGKKIRYAVQPGSLNWERGTLGADGTEAESTTDVRTDYINSTDLLIRLPEETKGSPTAYARAHYYGVDGYLSSVDITANWTVLGDLGIPADAVGVRLTAYAADGSAVTDAAALGDSIVVTGNKRQSVVPLTFHSGGLSEENGAETADTAYSRTGYLSVRDVLVKPEGRTTFMPFFYDSDKQFISCGSFFMTRAKKVLNLAPPSAAYVRFLLWETPAEPEGEEPISESVDGVVPSAMAQFFAYAAGSDAYRDFEAEADAEETKPTEPTEPSVPSVPSQPTDPTGTTTSTSTTTGTTTSTTTSTTKPTTPDEPLVLTADKPENQGVQNALWNMQQMVDITYTPIKAVPQTMKNYPANVAQKGLPYSSTRIEQAYVPNNVSFHTFMTALKNPNSYLYTVDLYEDYNNKNGKTYYGTVCSTACAYALGIVPNYTTYQWTEIPGMTLLEQQDLQCLKLCDTIVGQGHVAMITGIVRDQHGNIVTVTVSESAGSDVHSGKYTITALEERFPSNLYEYCRYSKLADVTYTPSDYVAVGDEKAKTVSYNTVIIPRKGDEANWCSDETVVLDVLSTSGYTDVEIYRWVSDAWQLEETRSVSSVVKLKGLKAGIYRARVVGPKKNSKYCKWLVTNVTSSAELYQGTRQVKVSFACSGNAEPLYIQWINASSNATVHITLLTDAQKEVGYGIYKPAKGYLKARVAFKTKYGIIYAELPSSSLHVQ